jgi:hypothetical protein
MRAPALFLPSYVVFLDLLPLPLGEGWGEGLTGSGDSCCLGQPRTNALTLTLSQRERELVLRLRDGFRSRKRRQRRDDSTRRYT